MKVIVFLIFIFLIGFLSGCSGVKVDVVKSEFEGIFRNTKVFAVKESEVKGLYEIYVGSDSEGSKENVNVIYYYPSGKVLIFGEIWSLNGTSLTGERRVEFLRERLRKNKGLE